MAWTSAATCPLPHRKAETAADRRAAAKERTMKLSISVGITTLGFLAARTSPIRLGTAVTAATFRAPALLIKAVTTVDVLSGGRAWLGLGAGYNDEAGALGLFMAPVAGGSTG